MRSLMLALGACLFALNFAGCSSTGTCGCGESLLGGNVGCNSGCSGCGESACSGGCGQNDFARKNYGGQTGLGLGLMEAGPSCKSAGCKGGCNTCQRIQRPRLASRLGGRLAARRASCGCDVGSDCGCDAPAPTMAVADCGCDASAPVEFSMGDAMEGACGCGSGDCDGGCDIQLVGHDDRRGLLAMLGFGAHLPVRSANGCGVRGCGGPAGLCRGCLGRLGGAGSIPHRDPSIHAGGMGAGPAGQIPTYAYPYYTTRAPRDFLDPNPPTIGY